jgi:hypothetical protein
MERPSDAGRGSTPNLTTAASRLRVERRRLAASDGPFSETKEWLGSAVVPAGSNLTS